LSSTAAFSFSPLLSVMAPSSNGRSQGGAAAGVAHALGSAGYGAPGLRTGRPVPRSACRCGRENAKTRTGRGVPFGLPHPVRAASHLSIL
jgi:hypothetical protein